MKLTSSVFLLLAIVIATSCSKKISPERPLLSNTDFKLDSLPVSEINIPLRINLKPFFAMAEKQVDTLFTSPDYPNGWVQSACDTRYKYSFRRSPLQLRAAGSALNLGFTGYYRIIGSTRVCVAGAGLTSWTAPCRCGYDEPERRVNVSFSNTFTLLPDYKIKLGIKRNEPQALDKCEVCFWGQDITKQVLNGLKTELDTAKATLERNYGTVNLRAQFQQLWNQLNKPYNVYEMGWIQMNPQQVHINNLFAKNDSLYVSLGLTAKPVISFERPADLSPAMPNLGNAPRDPGFSIFMDATLNYDSLSVIMNRYLSGKEFDFKKGPVNKKFVIKECRLFGTGNEKMVIKVDFGGTNSGTVYLTGKPVYTKESRVLELKDVDFDIRTRNALLNTAEWLFNRRIITEITRNTRFELGTYIDSAKVTVSQQLNREWMPGINSSGHIKDIQLIGLYPTHQALIIRSNCTGELAVKVDAVDFSL